MKNNNWHGLLEIEHIEHLSRTGEVLWEARNLKNILHNTGEEYILRAVFTGGVANSFIPSGYYFGLDSRATLSATDTMASLFNEPATNGYSRKIVSSTSEFAVSLDGSNYIAKSPILTFSATGGSYSALNLFFTTSADDSGYLISSVALSSTLTINDGEAVNLRMALKLKDCP